MKTLKKILIITAILMSLLTVFYAMGFRITTKSMIEQIAEADEVIFEEDGSILLVNCEEVKIG